MAPRSSPPRPRGVALRAAPWVCAAVTFAAPAAGATPPDEPSRLPTNATSHAPEDAAERSSLRVAAALGKGVTITAPDDAFTLNLRGRIQVIGLVVSDPAEDDGPEERFAVRRARVALRGQVLRRRFEYYLQLGFANQDQESDLRTPLRDAAITWNAHRDVALRFGQMKVPFGRQRVVSSSALELVDRSIVVGELSLDRDVGAYAFATDLFGAGERVAYWLGVFGGDGRNRLANAPGVMPVVRVEVSPFGRLAETEGDLERRPRFGLSFAVSAAYNANTNRSRSTFGDPYAAARFDYAHLAYDALARYAGLSVTGEVYVRRASEASATATVEGKPKTEYTRPASGYFVQVSQVLPGGLQVAARWGEILPAPGADPALARQRELGAGASYYLHGHDVKVQVDYFYLPQGAAFGGGKHQGRLQTQVYF